MSQDQIRHSETQGLLDIQENSQKELLITTKVKGGNSDYNLGNRYKNKTEIKPPNSNINTSILQ